MFGISRSAQKILLVDDDPNQIVFLNKTLENIAAVHFALNGRDALDMAIELQPDLVLLDIEMPGCDGFEVCRLLRADVRTAGITVIFLTGHTETDVQLQCFQAGGVDFIGKPFQPEVVGARVRTHLRLRQKERELIEAHQHARVTLKSIGDAVITSDLDGVVTYMNPVAESMIGLSCEQAVGLQVEQVMPLRVGGDGRPHINPLRLALRERRVVGMAMDCEMLSRKGHWIPVEDSAAPLMSERGEVLGGVIVFHDVSEARAMALKMSHLAHYDQLTNLPNRILLVDRIETAISDARRAGRRMGVLVINIDHFKLINTEFGFAFGDRVLQDLSSAFQNVLMKGETLSRHNNDGFIVVVPDIDQLSQLADLAVVIQSATLQVATASADLSDLTVSQGISVFPDDAGDQETLVRHADAAMYKAKSQHPGTYCFFSTEIDHAIIKRRRTHGLLQAAISQQGVAALYQPLIDAGSGTTVAVEALMRIRCPDGQLLPPADFMELAEETRLIIPLGQLLITRVLEQLQSWHDAGHPIRGCINISAVQFTDPEFWPALRRTIESSRIDPRKIELEVTESLMLHNVSNIAQVMHEMRTLGITVSIDDFGTGYSSLAYLRDLPVDVLKIDRRFVADMTVSRQGETLVRTIVAMAKSIGLDIVAEGVERPEQAAMLRQMEVNLLQGYLYSKPVPGDDIRFAYAG